MENDNLLEAIEAAREERTLPLSFAAALFTGEFKVELLDPFPGQPPEDSRLADGFISTLMSMLKEKLDPDEVDASGEIPKEVMDEMVHLGVFAMKIPKQYGGLGFSHSNYHRVMMQVASHCASTAVLISAHQSIGVPQPLKMFGTEAQKAKYFPRFSQGAISAFALTEPDVGSDPAHMKAEAKFSEAENCYILNGEKLWCTNGPIAEIIIVIAKTAPKIVRGKEKSQMSAFILEMNSPGVEVAHRCRFMGLNGIYNGLLRFHDVRIPKENLLGEEGRGLAMALATVNVGRLTLPMACTGVAKEALSIARTWGKERVQWGQPIGLHQVGKEKIAFISATTFAMEAIGWLTSGWQDKGNLDIRIEAAMAKLFCTESLWKIVDLTLQLRGGRGYEKASSLKARGEKGIAIERMMRDCRINTIIEGSSEIMRLFLAREALDPYLQKGKLFLKKKGLNKVGGAFELMRYYSGWYLKQLVKPLLVRPVRDFGPFRKQMIYVERASHKIARALFYGIIRYRQGLEKQQLLLGRLMDIGVELFAMTAVCSYAHYLQKNQEEKCANNELPFYFCALSQQRVETLFKALHENVDRKGDVLAEKVLDEEYLWLEKFQ